jgi:hypothetical protein
MNCGQIKIGKCSLKFRFMIFCLSVSYLKIKIYKVIMLVLLPDKILVLISVRGSVNPSYSAAGRILSAEISNDLIGNGTRDLRTCNTVPKRLGCTV